MSNLSLTETNGPKLELKQKSLQHEFKSLAVRTVIVTIGAWVSLSIFQMFVAPAMGLKHLHIQATETAITIIIALILVIAVRRILRKFSGKIPAQFSAVISFFIIIVISLIVGISLLYQWDIQPQEILVGGGVVAIIIGIGVSTIVGNIFSGGLMLTTFPAKIGDSIFLVNDNIRGKIDEINMMYTKIATGDGHEYVVPNSAIIQGSVRILKESLVKEQLPFSEGDRIELASTSEKYTGIVIKITPKFITLLSDDKETNISYSSVLNGDFIITKSRTKHHF